ncbi:branched-chain amino acid ABC transporter permease [Sporomusa sp.]|uniref:branched-chain amino acid ABC transporter permease n=1 Tax=Sporomusa sp. TaxID=2078658 RepID=UPI002B7428C4|nr:branched-chain amino acid ABC transporter permease [Sporomusa sp.]HWR41728.1 branched-chain amino acid ABC transporter permease [Sporomusa sp.]
MMNGQEKIAKLRNRLQLVGLTPLGAGLLFLVAILPLVLDDEFTIRLLISSLMYGCLAMAFDFTAGFINITNFGFAAFWGLGAYTSGLLVLKLGWSPWLGLIAGAVMSGLLGFGLGVLTLRLAGIFASCMTWFVALGMMAIAGNWVNLTRGNSGLSVPALFNTTDNLPYFYVMFIITVLVYLLLIKMTKSHIGLAFRAIGQDLHAAQASGINVTYYKIINFTTSCAIAGLVGAFYGHFVGILTPQVMHTKYTVEMMAIAFVGGRGSIWGGLLAAMLMIPTMEQMKGLLEWRLIIYGVLMIAVMVFYPAGLAGLYHTLSEKLGKILFSSKNTRKEVSGT